MKKIVIYWFRNDLRLQDKFTLQQACGLAWFESQLLDYDVCSNQGNCLYLAGLGTDPRGYLGGLWFEPKKQAKQHDPDGSYRQLWSTQ